MKAYDENHSQIITGHKYKDKDNDNDNDKDKDTDEYDDRFFFLAIPKSCISVLRP